MKQDPTWLRPKRWLAFFLTLLGVCSFLAIVPISTQDSGSLSTASELSTGVQATSSIDYLREGAREIQVIGHWTSLLPPLIAVMVAAFFRSMVAALVSAFVIGSFLSFGLNPLATAVLGVHDFLLVPTMSQFSVMIILFLISLVGMVHVMSQSGGLSGLVKLLEKPAKGRKRAKVAIALSGLVVFFDDYSNTVVVGATMRKLADRWKISREKLAYIVDSTTAPVAGLALLSTWVAFEVYLLGSSAESLGVGISGYGMLVEMLPMRFYCIGTLFFVFLNAGMGRDFGPMLAAERRSFHQGKLVADDHYLLAGTLGSEADGGKDRPPRWYNAALPIVVLLLGIVVGILLLGTSRLNAVGESVSLTTGEGLRAAFGAAVYDPSGDSDAGVMPALFIATIVAGLIAIAMPMTQGILKIGEVLGAYRKSLTTMWMAIFVLMMAWSMREICEGLGTAEYLLAILGDNIPVWLLPLLAFLVAAVMSFAMGTSWGSMGILIPIILPIAVAMGALETDHMIIFFLTAAAILDGSIFGDHCSPISDTTILSSVSSSCDHIAHVNTQLYYALATVVFSSVFGYLSVAQGMPLWLFYLLFPASTVGLLLILGRRSEEPEESKGLIS